MLDEILDEMLDRLISPNSGDSSPEKLGARKIGGLGAKPRENFKDPALYILGKRPFYYRDRSFLEENGG